MLNIQPRALYCYASLNGSGSYCAPLSTRRRKTDDLQQRVRYDFMALDLLVSTFAEVFKALASSPSRT